MLNYQRVCFPVTSWIHPLRPGNAKSSPKSSLEISCRILRTQLRSNAAWNPNTRILRLHQQQKPTKTVILLYYIYIYIYMCIAYIYIYTYNIYMIIFSLFDVIKLFFNQNIYGICEAIIIRAWLKMGINMDPIR